MYRQSSKRAGLDAALDGGREEDNFVILPNHPPA
jgi:hypothetical protein